MIYLTLTHHPVKTIDTFIVSDLRRSIEATAIDVSGSTSGACFGVFGWKRGGVGAVVQCINEGTCGMCRWSAAIGATAAAAAASCSLVYVTASAK